MEHCAEVVIPNKYGLHARPAAEFVKLANKFSCEVIVRKEEVEVSGKSIMGVMMLAAEHGSSIVICARGDDSDAAIDALRSLVSNGFGES